MKLTITVDETCIREGQEIATKTLIRCTKCPVARAFAKAGLKEVEVTNKRAFFSYRSASYTIDLPEFVQQKIDVFDDGKPVAPFTFSIEF